LDLQKELNKQKMTKFNLDEEIKMLKIRIKYLEKDTSSKSLSKSVKVSDPKQLKNSTNILV
jgi:hypothetical protein